MKANELRIGNKFQSPFGVETVFEIFDNTDRGRLIQKGYEHIITCKENGNQYKPIEIEPIPLTPEILEKCGFGKIEIELELGAIFGIIKKGLHPLMLKYNFLQASCFYGFYYGTKVEYLHQLQNLYFALTGEELEINL